MSNIAHHLFSVFAVVGYDEYNDTDYTIPLHTKPILATFDEITQIGDLLTSDMDGVIGINYDSAWCSHCENCKCYKWVPHHPLFKCSIGGEINPRTQQTITCPSPDSAEKYLSI